MTSCLGGDDETIIDDWVLGNAQISGLLLTNDSISGLSNVKFTVDQLNGKIFNKDSMPYGTVIDEKVLCKLTFDSYYEVANVSFVNLITNDTVWGTTDSIDFSSPVEITVYPLDGVTTKKYEVQINIHQVNPETMVWQKHSDLFSDKKYSDMKVIPFRDSYYMYVSENGVYSLFMSDTEKIDNWREITLSGFPEKAVLSQITENDGNLYIISEDGGLYCSSEEQNSSDEQQWSQVEGLPVIKTLLGFLSFNLVSSRPPVISGIAIEDGTMKFFSMFKNNSWSTGSIVPANFPVSGFGSIYYESMHNPRIVVAAGRDMNDNLTNNVWSTMDGLSWALISNNGTSFSPREGVALSIYDNCFFMVGGIDSKGHALKDIYFSVDQGITWFYNYFAYVDSEDEESEEQVLVEKFIYNMPEEYAARGFNSVIVDNNNYMLFFGGKAGKDTNVLSDLWRGRINRLGFGKE
jgi:hypothetical protein